MTELPPLDAGEFPETFAAIHGHAPYAWQTRLLKDVADSGIWPSIIAAPTGAGKTAVLDVALFHLGLQAGVRPRVAPMRIVLAVDRRIIVDQAFERARRIRDALEAAQPGSALGRMAARLRALSGDRPLHVAELRGGMPLEHDWARRPDQPTVLCTTVDQLGSRLLFRGYGVSDAMAPVHAGLLGCDALLILDEAHLSRAFADTLAAIAQRRGVEGTLGLPWAWCALTATPRGDAQDAVFRLTDTERTEDAIRRRLTARKEVRLSLAEGDANAEAFAAHAQALRKHLADAGQGAPAIAVVVNRVMLARQVFEALHEDKASAAILLTGRVRPAERDHLIKQCRDRLEGRAQDADRPLFVVATQCIEAGADFDFDAMVSQIAPLDALRQRFGRLARSGNRDGRAAPGIIVAARSETGKNATDPIYGSAPARTWEWLARVAQQQGRERIVDFGPDALDALIAGQPPGEDCRAPAPAAPPLREADLAALAMTAPRPFPDPDPAPFLHGDFRDEAEIGLVWRGDLDGLLDRLPDDRDGALAGLTELLAFLPPRPAEALRLPLWAARHWLAGATPDDRLADIPAGAVEEGGGSLRNGPRPVLRWRGRGDLDHVSPAELRAGDVVVLPGRRGGCDAFGWAPASATPVADIADRAAAPHAGQRAALRLHPAVWPDAAAPWAAIAALLAAGAGAAEIARATGLPGWSGAKGLALAEPYGDDRAAGAVLVALRGLATTEGPSGSRLPATEGDEGLFAPAPVALSDHAIPVAAMARRHAEALGLPETLAGTLAAAGLWHDDGKADPRFQLWLRSIEGLPEDGPPIAKTGARTGPGRERALRAAASLPPRWRHEVASVRIAAARLAQGATVADPELLLWLIGTHHGHGRPFFPHDDDWDAYPMTLLGVPLAAAPGPDKLDFDRAGTDWAGLMDRLQTCYGLWGLAFLEACLRLADHRASAGEKP